MKNTEFDLAMIHVMIILHNVLLEECVKLILRKGCELRIFISEMQEGVVIISVTRIESVLLLPKNIGTI